MIESVAIYLDPCVCSLLRTIYASSEPEVYLKSVEQVSKRFPGQKSDNPAMSESKRLFFAGPVRKFLGTSSIIRQTGTPAPSNGSIYAKSRS